MPKPAAVQVIGGVPLRFGRGAQRAADWVGAIITSIDEAREPERNHNAVDRSQRTAELRASPRVQRFLDAGRAIITEKDSLDFTVQEVVERADRTLRSFYLVFDGKHELLLVLYTDALAKATDQIRAATALETGPLGKLRSAVELLFQFCRPDVTAHRPLLTEFAPQLVMSRPADVRVAHAPVFELFTDLMTEAADAGLLAVDAGPRRLAAITMQSVMFVAAGAERDADSMSAEDVWVFCARGVVRARGRDSPR